MFMRAFAAVSAIACVFTLGTAHGQEYPTRPVTVVLPYAVGGGVDLIGRIIAAQLSEDNNQRFVVENKLGASGIVGAQMVSEAKPDGYTLVYTSGITMSTAPAMLKGSSFDFVRDLTPIAETAFGPEVFVVNLNVPAKTFGELLPYLKQHPDFKWSTGGVGSLEHLTIAALNKQIGASAVIAAYNGVGPGTAAAVAGEVNGALAPLPGVRGSVEAGTLRALAVTSAVRMPQLPNVPTVAESGFPGFESYNWQGIWGPKQMPKELVNNIHDKIVKALANAATKERIAAGGFAVPPTKTPEQFAAYVKSEVAKYDPILTDLNLKGSQ